jgi:hypothetical protein
MNLPAMLLSLIAQAPPASLAEQEVSVPGGTLLLIAYMGLWVVILGFVVLILRQQQAASRDLDELERRLNELAERAAPDKE